MVTFPGRSRSAWRHRKRVPLPAARLTQNHVDVGASANLAAKIMEEARLAHNQGRISQAALAALSTMEEAGEPAAVLWPWFIMAECGVPSATWLPTTHHDNDVPVLDGMPSATAFFEDFVLPSRPVVLRGALNLAMRPARDLADVDYLRRRCGHRRIPVKSLPREDLEGRRVFVTDPDTRLPFSAFLDAMSAAERDRTSKCPFYLGKIPLKSELPELDLDLQQAVPSSPWPPRLYERCFGPLSPEGVFTYLGCSRNVTATHFDNSENLMLCIHGTKRLWLFPPSDTPFLSPAADLARASRADAPPFCKWTDLPADLQGAFPALARASPVEVLLEAGDALYLPACYWHCVEGSEGRNMILSYWFGLHPRKAAQEQGGCADKWREWVHNWPAPVE